VPLTAYAQRTTYSIDNFDFRNGVKAEQPAATPEVKRTARAAKKRTDRVASETSAVGASQLVVPTVWTPGPSSNVGALRGYTTGSSEVDGYLLQSGTNNGVDPLLLYSVMHQESSFKSHAVSPKGARGLMQLLPVTATRLGVKDIFDPAQNIDAGTRYLSELMARYQGDLVLSLAAYNAGPGAVQRYGRVPPYNETISYVRAIRKTYAQRKLKSAAASEAKAVVKTEVTTDTKSAGQ